MTRDEWRSEFRAVPSVQPCATSTLTTIASFVSEAGVPGLQGDAVVPPT